MNTNSRLKFAWARGARFQAQHAGVDVGGPWFDLELAYYDPDSTLSFRVHPHDAHLEYGPLSSALIDQATSITGMPFDPVMYLSAESFIRWALVENREVQVIDHDEMIMLKLFYAEYLADQGL